MISQLLNVLTKANGVPAKSVQVLVALAYAKSDEVTYGHGGFGNSQYLAAELVKSMRDFSPSLRLSWFDRSCWRSHPFFSSRCSSSASMGS